MRYFDFLNILYSYKKIKESTPAKKQAIKILAQILIFFNSDYSMKVTKIRTTFFCKLIIVNYSSEISLKFVDLVKILATVRFRTFRTFWLFFLLFHMPLKYNNSFLGHPLYVHIYMCVCVCVCVCVYTNTHWIFPSLPPPSLWSISKRFWWNEMAMK